MKASSAIQILYLSFYASMTMVNMDGEAFVMRNNTTALHRYISRSKGNCHQKQKARCISDEEPLYEFPVILTVFFISLYVVTSIVAVIGNSLVMYIVIFRRLRTVTNMYILNTIITVITIITIGRYIANLALADVIIGVFAIPFQFQAILLQRWTLPPFMCKGRLTAGTRK